MKMMTGSKLETSTSKTEPVFAGKSCRRSLPNNRLGGGEGWGPYPTYRCMFSLSRFCELSYDLICAGRDMNVFSVWEMMLDMKASWDGSDWNIWETSQSFCLDYEESLEQFGSPWISRGKEFTSKTECVALHVCYVINTSFSSFEFFWRYMDESYQLFIL